MLWVIIPSTITTFWGDLVYLFGVPATLLLLKTLDLVWRLYLNYRQQKIIDFSPSVPRELSYYMTESTHNFTKNAARERLAASSIAMVVDYILILIFYLSLGPHHLWEICRALSSSNEARNFLFVLLLVTLRNLKLIIIKYIIVKLPEQHRVAPTSCESPPSIGGVGEFLRDLSYFAPVALLFNKSLHDSPNFLLLLLAATSLHRAFVSEAYLQFIKRKSARPLPEGELKQRVEQMAETYGYPRSSILIADSCQVEGYVPGLNSGLIVLGNVLQGYCQEDQGGGHAKTFEIQEILAFLGHELAHWTYWHRLKAVVFQQISFTIKILFCMKCMREQELYNVFHIDDPQPLVGFILTFYCILENFSTTLSWLERVYIRSQEYEADTFVRVLGKGPYLRSALLKMNARCEVLPRFDSLYSSYYFSLPSPLQRVQKLSTPLRMRVVFRHRNN